MGLLTVVASMACAQGNPVDDCVSKTTMEGSFMGGRIFKAQALIPNTTQADLMKKVAKTLLKEGLTIGTLDKDLGLLTASFSKRAVGSDNPMTTTLSMTFETNKTGVDGTATLNTPAGITTNEERNRKELCALLLL